MPVSAYFEKTRDSGEGSNEIFLRLGEAKEKDQVAGLIHSITETSMLIEALLDVEAGVVINVNLPNIGTHKARVSFATGQAIHCLFVTPLADVKENSETFEGVMSHELLRSPIGPVPVGESMGTRIQRLRYQQGISQTEIALKMNVSNPAVSAWEQDKSRPTAGRLAALARLLNVSSDELLSGRQDSSALTNVVARCREMIADAAGTLPEQVRISIDV